jgi:hypothetical protein
MRAAIRLPTRRSRRLDGHMADLGQRSESAGPSLRARRWDAERVARALVPRRDRLVDRLPRELAAARGLSRDQRELVIDEAIDYLVTEYAKPIADEETLERAFWATAAYRVKRVHERRGETIRAGWRRVDIEEIDLPVARRRPCLDRRAPGRAWRPGRVRSDLDRHRASSAPAASTATSGMSAAGASSLTCLSCRSPRCAAPSARSVRSSNASSRSSRPAASVPTAARRSRPLPRASPTSSRSCSLGSTSTTAAHAESHTPSTCARCAPASSSTGSPSSSRCHRRWSPSGDEAGPGRRSSTGYQGHSHPRPSRPAPSLPPEHVGWEPSRRQSSPRCASAAPSRLAAGRTARRLSCDRTRPSQPANSQQGRRRDRKPTTHGSREPASHTRPRKRRRIRPAALRVPGADHARPAAEPRIRPGNPRRSMNATSRSRLRCRREPPQPQLSSIRRPHRRRPQHRLRRRRRERPSFPRRVKRFTGAAPATRKGHSARVPPGRSHHAEGALRAGARSRDRARGPD